jgi:tetratricopeptide (TPR) repeat protein
MIARWQRGERPLAEEYLDGAADLRRCPEAAFELIAEELALRDEFGQPTSPTDLAERFPHWQAQMHALANCHRVLGPQATPLFPSPGEVLGDFHLLSELGRGGHGRVYLAAQPSLGRRPVVLKLGPVAGDEHLSLARLQHTHIVPLFSAHEFPDRGLRGLCLPYFGGATLADILDRIGKLDRQSTGVDVLAGLRRADPRVPSVRQRGPAWGVLGQQTYSEVICWIGACLADALQFAHDHDLLHLDLTPANVLIAEDGVPMLLDFHLARPPLVAGESAPAWIGGTPGYMAPEQEAAVRAIQEGAAVPEGIDGRADVFALGVVLAKALQTPTHRPGYATPVGLSDILTRCTAADPTDRYPTAADLATDLRRHLAHLPLKGVANRSLPERWQKWRRRQPYALPLALAASAFISVLVGFVVRSNRQVERAEMALQDGDANLRLSRYAEAAEACRGGEALLEGMPLHQELRSRLRDSRRVAERGMAADELHSLAEQVRPFYATDVITPEQKQQVEGRCRELWTRRELIARTLGGQPTPELEARWRADLLDLGILVADFGIRSAPSNGKAAAHRRALDTLDEAETLLGSSGALALERVRHARALGMSGVADAAAHAAAATPRGSWDHLALGRAAFGAGDFRNALAAMNLALELDPGSFWASYYGGACRLQLGDATGALAAFSSCVSLAPGSAWCYLNRGLAFAELGQPDPARADFDRAIALDPGLGAAWLARATTHHRAGKYADALADLQRAAGCGVPASQIEYQKAVVLLGTNNRQAATASLRSCLADDPGHRLARELLDQLATRR